MTINRFFVSITIVLSFVVAGFAGCDNPANFFHSGHSPVNDGSNVPSSPRPEKPSSGTFWEAVQNEDWSLVRRWIEYDPSLVDSRGHLTVVRFVFGERQELPMEGMTPLLLATFRGNLDMVKFLVEHGANVNGTDVHKRTALHFAYSFSHDDIKRYLIGKGADTKARDSNGAVPGEIK